MASAAPAGLIPQQPLDGVQQKRGMRTKRRRQPRSRAGGRQQPAPGQAAQPAGCKAGGSVAEPATKCFADEAVSDLRQPQPQTPRSIAAKLGEPPRSRVSPLQFSGVRQELHVELHVGQDGELCCVPAHRF